MKSIMQEASSVSKAIDLAWNRAEKPSQFSVKILEEPEHNLFGLTVKSAKIAIFFEEKRKIDSFSRQPERYRAPYPEPQKQPQEPAKPVIIEQSHLEQSQKRARPEWTDAMAQEAKSWIDQTLQLIGASDAIYNFSRSKSAIKVIFDKSVTGSENKDRMLFSSFANLILSTLRHRHKRQLRNLKVILLIA